MKIHPVSNSGALRAVNASLRRIWIVLTCAMVAGCNALTFNAGMRNYAQAPDPDQAAARIYEDPRPFWDLIPPEAVCVMQMDKNAAVSTNINGGLIELRHPEAVDTATLQAALTAEDRCQVRMVKMQIDLYQGLVVGTTHFRGEAKLLTDDGVVWVANGLFRFTLTEVDLGAIPVRSRGEFKFVARRLTPPDPWRLFVQGSFTLPFSPLNSTFIP